MQNLEAFGRRLGRVAKLAVGVVILTSAVFVGYLLAGFTITYIHPGALPFQFLALHDDPVLAVFGVLVGTLLSVAGLCIIGYAILSHLDSLRTKKVILAGMITIVCGLTTLWFTSIPLRNFWVFNHSPHNSL